MIEGFKNREVVSDKQTSSLNTLSSYDRNEYLRDGFIKADFDIDSFEEVRPLSTNRQWSKMYKIDELVRGEFYRCEISQDGLPVTYFLNYDLGMISVIRYSDSTAIVGCTKSKNNIDLCIQMLKDGYDADLLDNFIRVKLGVNKSISENFYKIKSLIDSK